MTIITAIVWLVAILGGLFIAGYLVGLAIGWWMDAESRALERWLEEHIRQLHEDEEKYK
jgi:ABC-type transporter Mla maintaining outer membrane lipid asymmetry permease subunit MlaE